MMHDDEDREYRRLSRRTFGAFGLAWLFLIAGEIAAVTSNNPHDWHAVAILLPAVALIFYAAVKLVELRAMAYPRHHREVNQTSYRFMLVAFSFITGLGAQTLSQLSLPLTSHHLASLIVPVLYYVITPAMFLLGPNRKRAGDLADDMACDDELTQALRARALRFGYAAALIILAGTCIALLLRPDALMPVMAWGLAAAEIIPIAIYVALDWLSERGETP